MVALAIDTAANICAVAIGDMADNSILTSLSSDIGRGHAEVLMDMIEQCLDQANVGYADIERVISSTGPGSFTGVRVGLSCARAIALALNIPVIGISNLQSCAAHAIELMSSKTDNLNIIVILDARRGDVYLQQFQNGQNCSEAVIGCIDDLAKSHRSDDIRQDMYCGSGAQAFVCAMGDSDIGLQKKIVHNNATAPIECIARLGMAADIPMVRPEPLYLRGADAKIQQGFAVERSGGPEPSS